MYKRFLNTFIGILAVAMFAIAANAGTPVSKAKVAQANKYISYVTVQQAHAALHNKNVVFVDVRTYPEYVAGHIPGAIWAPRGLLDFKAYSWLKNKNKTYYVYCKTGARGAISTYDLIRLGYKAKDIKYSWWAWTHAKYKVEKGKPAGMGKGILK